MICVIIEGRYRAINESFKTCLAMIDLTSSMRAIKDIVIDDVIDYVNIYIIYNSHVFKPFEL